MIIPTICSMDNDPQKPGCYLVEELSDHTVRPLQRQRQGFGRVGNISTMHAHAQCQAALVRAPSLQVRSQQLQIGIERLQSEQHNHSANTECLCRSWYPFEDCELSMTDRQGRMA